MIDLNFLILFLIHFVFRKLAHSRLHGCSWIYRGHHCPSHIASASFIIFVSYDRGEVTSLPYTPSFSIELQVRQTV